MSTVIGTLAYKLTGDTSSLTKATMATKAELREVNRIMRETRTPAEQYQQSLNKLDSLYQKGLISLDTYGRKLTQAKVKLQELDGTAAAFRQSQAALNEEQRQAALVQDQLRQRATQLYTQTRSPAEQYAAKIRELKHLLREQAISQDVANRAAADAKRVMHEQDGTMARLAQRKREEADTERRRQQLLQRGAELTRSTQTALERYTAKIRDYQSLLRNGAITQTTFNRATAQAKSEYMAATQPVSRYDHALSQLAGRFPILAAAADPAIGSVIAFGAAVTMTTRGVRDLVQTGANFEFSMSRVKALSSANTEQFARLTGQARQLGASTEFTATQAAEGMQFFALAGFETNEIYEAMPATLQLASAGQISVAESADIASKTMRGLNIEADQFIHVADIMTQAITNSNTDMLQLGEAMKFVAPIAATLDKGLAETTSSVMILSNAGLQGEMAGTALRQSLIKLAKPSDDGAKALKKLGISALDVDGNMRPLPDLIDDFNTKMADMGSGEKLAILSRIFEARAATGFAILLRQGGDEMRRQMDLLAESSGRAAEIQQMQLDNVKGSWIEFKSAMEGVKITAFDIIAADLQVITDLATSSAQGVNLLGDTLGDAVVSIIPYGDKIRMVSSAWRGLKSIVSETGEVLDKTNPLAAAELGKEAGDVVDPGLAEEIERERQAAEKAATSLDKLIESNRERMDVLHHSADTLQLYEAAQLGATDAELGYIRQQQAMIKELEREQSIKKVIEALDEEIAKFGLSAEALRLYEAAQMGATQAELETINAQNEILARLEREQEEREKLKKDRDDAAKALERETKQWEEFGQTLFEQTRTPLEEFNEAIVKIDEALSRGVITWETYDRAVEQAKKKLEEATKEEEKVRGPDASRVGTVGALQRGTSEAFSASNRARQAQELRPMENLMRQELVESKKQTEALLGIRAAQDSQDEINVIGSFV